MNNMFWQNSTFNQSLNSWDVSSVTDMFAMFFGASAFNQPLNSWNVSNVTRMTEMFRSATAFNQDIGGWNVSNVTNFLDFMRFKTNANYSATNLNSIYNNWSLLTLNPNLNINFGTIKYTLAGQAGRNILTGAPNNWTITDGGT
jgi:surface protein